MCVVNVGMSGLKTLMGALMLKARLNSGMFVLGLDAENIRRLTSGQPIIVCLAEVGGTDDVLIMAGDTLANIQRELEENVGPLPKPFDAMRH